MTHVTPTVTGLTSRKEDPVTPHPGTQAETGRDIYDDLHASAEFIELKRRYRSFVLPATFAFLGWYLLYVVLSNWGGDFMDHRVVGTINVALLFGLLQFVTTFVIAWLYSRYSSARLDPLARSLEEQFVSRGGQTGGQ